MGFGAPWTVRLGMCCSYCAVFRRWREPSYVSTPWVIILGQMGYRGTTVRARVPTYGHWLGFVHACGDRWIKACDMEATSHLWEHGWVGWRIKSYYPLGTVLCSASEDNATWRLQVDMLPYSGDTAIQRYRWAMAFYVTLVRAWMRR